MYIYIYIYVHMYVCMYELCSNGIVLLTALRECLCSSLRAAYAPSVLAEDSLCAGIAFADARHTRVFLTRGAYCQRLTKNE